MKTACVPCLRGPGQVPCPIIRDAFLPDSLSLEPTVEYARTIRAYSPCAYAVHAPDGRFISPAVDPTITVLVVKGADLRYRCTN